MNEKQAIETLQDMKGVFGGRGHEQYALLALDLAITSLEKQMTNYCDYENNDCVTCMHNEEMKGV